jgi:hypothetical protein
VPLKTDLDIRVEDLSQIPDLREALQKNGLQVRNKKQFHRYGQSVCVQVTSVFVTAHDILSGYRATVKVDFVLVKHPELFMLDFDINGLSLVLGPNVHFLQDMTFMHPEVLHL